MKITRILLGVLVFLSVLSCTENQRARTLGGVSTINLPKNRKLITATWKEANFWYLTRPKKAGDESETYEFCESSNFGIIEGKMIIVETFDKN